jgi:hypothetical protein
MSRWFCGPDRTGYTTIAFDSPSDCLATFLGAVRRADPAVVYRCLDSAFVQERGLDGILVEAAWERLSDETPQLHLLGHAQLGKDNLLVAGDHARALFRLAGAALQVDLIRRPYWEIRYRTADGRSQEHSALMDEADLCMRLKIEERGRDPIDDVPQSNVRIGPLPLLHPGLEAFTVAQLDSVAMGREWKIVGLKVQDP